VDCVDRGRGLQIQDDAFLAGAQLAEHRTEAIPCWRPASHCLAFGRFNLYDIGSRVRQHFSGRDGGAAKPYSFSVACSQPKFHCSIADKRSPRKAPCGRPARVFASSDGRIRDLHFSEFSPGDCFGHNGGCVGVVFDLLVQAQRPVSRSGRLRMLDGSCALTLCRRNPRDRFSFALARIPLAIGFIADATGRG
jgi:hypothetical protein